MLFVLVVSVLSIETMVGYFIEIKNERRAPLFLLLLGTIGMYGGMIQIFAW